MNVEDLAALASSPTGLATAAGILAAGGAAAAGFSAASKRGLIRARVQCWFCHERCRVPYPERNAWTCGECWQYNGFSADGDYNRDDPDRRRVWPEEGTPGGDGPRRFARPGSLAPGTSGSGDNGLCRTCNLNQSLKVHQLAKFVPKVEANYDREVEEFQEHLERTYKLCRNCEASVHQSLGEQNSWLKPSLLAWKLEKGRRRSPGPGEGRRSAKSNPGGVVSWRLAPFSSDGGSSSPRLRALTAVSSVALCSLGSFSDLDRTDSVLLQFALALLVLLLWSLSWLWRPSAPRATNLLVALTFLPACALSISPEPWFALAWHARAVCLASALANLLRRARRSPIEARKRRKKIREQQQQQDQHQNFEQFESASFLEGTVTPDNVDRTVTPSDNVSLVSQASQTSSDLLGREGDDCDLSTLSIEEDENLSGSLLRRRNTRASDNRSPTTFSLKDYGGGDEVSLGCFRRPSVLKPARFNPNGMSPSKRVVKASWVAGGYWQRNSAAGEQDSESLSRASSQSSGFISQSGEPPMGLLLPQHQQHQLSLPPRPPPQFSPAPSSVLDQQLNLSASSSVRNGGLFGAAGDAFERASLASERLAGGRNFGVGARPDSSLSHLESFGGGPSQSMIFNNTAASSSRPRAESSPVSSSTSKKSSVLDTQFNVKCTLSSLLLFASVVVNLSLIAYVCWKFI